MFSLTSTSGVRDFSSTKGRIVSTAMSDAEIIACTEPVEVAAGEWIPKNWFVSASCNLPHKGWIVGGCEQFYFSYGQLAFRVRKPKSNVQFVQDEIVVNVQYKSNIDVSLIQSCGGDHMVVAAAKVSTSGDEALTYASQEQEASYGLINYLMKHRHGTPFEHASLTFYVRAPIFVWREWHRHRIGFSYNEESARYTTLEPVFYVPDRDRPMMKVDGWKPGRPKFTRCEDDDVYNKLVSNLKDDYTRSYQHYLENLQLGIDPGLARDGLNVGIYSRCWVTCNPRSLMAFLSLRTHDVDAGFVSYPLWEIELGARACEEMFAKGWPLTYKAFCENGRVGP